MDGKKKYLARRNLGKNISFTMYPYSYMVNI